LEIYQGIGLDNKRCQIEDDYAFGDLCINCQTYGLTSMLRLLDIRANWTPTILEHFMEFSNASIPETVNVLVAFIDIQGLRTISDALKDPVKLFSFLDSWAKIVIKEVEGTDGKVLKFIGDECLIVFPDQSADSGIQTLLSAKRKVEKYFKSLGYANKVRITAHYGEAAIGEFGAGTCRNLDVIGETVNTAAGLGRGEHRGQLIISSQAFRKLSPVTRKRFHKYTPPIVYLAEDE